MTTWNVTDEMFDEDVLGATQPVLVEFYAEWCGPSKQMAPILDELSEELSPTITIAKADIDLNPQAARRYEVRGTPTMILFNRAQPVAAKIGSTAKEKVREWLEEFVDLTIVESARWTGRVRPKSPVQIRTIRKQIVALRGAVEQSELPLREKHQAMAHLYAVERLVQAPEPPWRLIVELLNHPVLTAFLNTAAILAIILS
jgi:thioredoxin 1